MLQKRCRKEPGHQGNQENRMVMTQEDIGPVQALRTIMERNSVIRFAS